MFRQQERQTMNHQLQARWIGGGIDNGRYEITGLPWYSHNGDYWYEQGTDNLIDSDDFHASTITLIGGPSDGKVIR